MVTESTTEILAIIISFGGVGELNRWAQRLVTLLTEHAEARDPEVKIIESA